MTLRREPGVDPVSAARGLVASAVERRARGELLPDRQLIDSHPDLMPELERELMLRRIVRRAYVAARKAGPAEPSPEPLQPVAARPGAPQGARETAGRSQLDGRGAAGAPNAWGFYEMSGDTAEWFMDSDGSPSPGANSAGPINAPAGVFRKALNGRPGDVPQGTSGEERNYFRVCLFPDR
jgi:hypothetical protein